MMVKAVRRRIAGWLLVVVGVVLPVQCLASATRQFADLALSPSNEPRVAAWDYFNEFVRVGVRSGSTWNCFQFSNAPGMGGANPVAGSTGVAIVDAGGSPYVAYQVNKVLFVENPSQCGVTQVERVQLWLNKGTTISGASQVCIDSTGGLFGCVNFSDVGHHVAMRRTGDGRVHVAYYNGAGQLRYAVSNATVTSFTSEAVTSGTQTNSGGDVAIAIDAAGQPHLAYIAGGQNRYAVKVGSVWSNQALNVPAYPAGYTGRRLTNVSLVLDAAGRASVLFTVGDSLWCARESATTVFGTAELVDGGAGLQGYPAVASGSDGVLHVAYFKDMPGNEVLAYVKRTSTGWNSPVNVAVHASGLGAFIGKRLAIATTAGAVSEPRIAYPEVVATGGEAVWLASLSGTSWSNDIILPCNETPPPGGGGGGGGSGGGGYEESGLLSGGGSPGSRTSVSIAGGTTLMSGSALRLRATAEMDADLRCDVLDIAGRREIAARFRLSSGDNEFSIATVGLPVGVHLVRVTVGSEFVKAFRIVTLK